MGVINILYIGDRSLVIEVLYEPLTTSEDYID
jgi:hypothetical protein